MQPAADPVSRLEHDALDAGVRQRVGGRQARDPGADHQYPPDGSRHPAGNVRSSAVKLPGYQEHPSSGLTYLA